MVQIGSRVQARPDFLQEDKHGPHSVPRQWGTVTQITGKGRPFAVVEYDRGGRECHYLEDLEGGMPKYRALGVNFCGTLLLVGIAGEDFCDVPAIALEAAREGRF